MTCRSSFPNPRFRLAVHGLVWRLSTLLLLLGSASAPALAQSTDAREVTSTSVSSQAAGADETNPETTTGGDESPAGGEDVAESEDDGYEWLVDEQDRLYRVATLPKVERTYKRLDDGFIRFPGGASFPLIKESDDTFWVKIYKPGQFKTRRVKPREAAISQAERAAIEAEFEVESDTVDRLELQPFDDGLPRQGLWRNGFDLADMNGDGHLDLVFGPVRKGSGRPVIFLHDGSGSWRRWEAASFESAAYDYGDVTAGDWNGDGHMDLAFGVHLRGLLAVTGDGKGNFRLTTEGMDFDIPGSGKQEGAFSSRAVATADWNGDGFDDVLAFGEGPKGMGRSSGIVQGSVGMRAFLSQGDGTWKAIALSPPFDRNFGEDFALFDLDGDGRDDIVTGTSVLGNSGIMLRRSDDPGARSLLLEPFDQMRERSLVDSLTVGDFDSDGRQDLVISFRAAVLGDWRAGIDLLHRRDDGWERRHVLSYKQRQRFSSLSAGDVDGDGHADLAAVDGFGKVHLLLGRGDGTFDVEASPEMPEARVGCVGFDVELRDLDGDGRAEIVAAFAGETQGLSGFGGAQVAGCEAGGSLRAWTPVARPAEADTASDS